MDIKKYLNKAGYDTVDSSFYSLIRVWKSWYVGDVNKFHRYKMYNGKDHVPCRRLSLGMAKKLSEDIADLLLNERVQITIQDETTSRWLEMITRKGKHIRGPWHMSRILIISR